MVSYFTVVLPTLEATAIPVRELWLCTVMCARLCAFALALALEGYAAGEFGCLDKTCHKAGGENGECSLQTVWLPSNAICSRKVYRPFPFFVRTGHF